LQLVDESADSTRAGRAEGKPAARGEEERKRELKVVPSEKGDWLGRENTS